LREIDGQQAAGMPNYVEAFAHEPALAWVRNEVGSGRDDEEEEQPEMGDRGLKQLVADRDTQSIDRRSTEKAAISTTATVRT
jgi:hypothetical protein